MKPTAATWATLSNYQQGFFYMHHPIDKVIHTTAIVTPVVEHWLEREIAQWVHSMKDRSDDPSHHERTLFPWSYYVVAQVTHDVGWTTSTTNQPTQPIVRSVIICLYLSIVDLWAIFVILPSENCSSMPVLGTTSDFIKEF